MEDHFYCPPAKIEFENRQPGYALNRPVHKRGPVNGESGEFERLREANERNHGG